MGVAAASRASSSGTIGSVGATLLLQICVLRHLMLLLSLPWRVLLVHSFFLPGRCRLFGDKANRAYSSLCKPRSKEKYSSKMQSMAHYPFISSSIVPRCVHLRISAPPLKKIKGRPKHQRLHQPRSRSTKSSSRSSKSLGKTAQLTWRF